MPFIHEWTPEEAESAIDRLQIDALTAGAAYGELIQKSPAPTGWPRRTGFLANSASHQGPERTATGFRAETNVHAEYWIWVNRKTKVLERAGEAAMRVVAKRMSR